MDYYDKGWIFLYIKRYFSNTTEFYTNIIMHPPQNKILNENISIDFNSLIGKGATGNVFKGLFLDPYPHPIAVKAIPLKEINN